jgi:hypothetical protein
MPWLLQVSSHGSSPWLWDPLAGFSGTSGDNSAHSLLQHLPHVFLTCFLLVTGI